MNVFLFRFQCDHWGGPTYTKKKKGIGLYKLKEKEICEFETV